jgi:alkylation response protein AidB-like acyl-CoA dehydrogenase
MDFSIAELRDDDLAFWNEVAGFFDEHINEDVHEEERTTGSGHNDVLHKALGERGWIMPRWPIDEGGAGLDSLRARILRLEMDRYEIPDVTMSTTDLTVAVVRSEGTETLKARVLPGVATGDIKICLGYTEPDGGSDLAGVRTRATRSDGGWIINGAKMFTTGAHNCQYSLLVTRTDPDAPKHRGITIFLVPLDGPGVEIQPVRTLGGERTNAVFYDNVFIEDDHRLGPVNQGWSVMRAPLEAEHGMTADDGLSEIEGGSYGRMLRKVLWHAVRWAQTPRPDGTVPFDDPVVSTTLAEIALEVEISRNAAGLGGRVFGSDKFISRAADILDLVGTEALLPRNADGAVEDGVFEWAHRFAQGTAIYGGTTDIAKNILAQQRLGLPRPPKMD